VLPVREMRKVPGLAGDSPALASVAVMLTVGVGGAPMVPGEPISFASFAAANAPLMPTALRVEMVALFSPAALSKVGNGPLGEAPKATPARSVPPASNRLT